MQIYILNILNIKTMIGRGGRKLSEIVGNWNGHGSYLIKYSILMSTYFSHMNSRT